MWTTSSSRARAATRRAGLALAGCGLLVLGVTSSDARGPDSPLPAEPKAQDKDKAAPPAPADDARPPSARPVELKSVVARKFNRQADQAIAKSVSPQALDAAANPLVIEVRLAVPIDAKPRTS